MEETRNILKSKKGQAALAGVGGILCLVMQNGLDPMTAAIVIGAIIVAEILGQSIVDRVKENGNAE
jgi:hypothetical protein